MSQYFAEHGAELFSVGVEVIPVVPRKKFPAIEGWQSMEITEEVVDDWVSTRPGHGVGVRGSSLPGLDVDVDDPEVAPALLAFLDDLIGRGPVRYGFGHKFLIPVETDLRHKIKSTIYQDANGKKYAIELLTTGQQWVAYGYHEQAGRDYRWERGDLADEFMTGLPGLSAVALSELLDRFDELARDKGWVPARARTGRVTESEDMDDLDLDLSGLKAPVGLSISEIEEIMIDHPCDLYDDWVRGGMAIYHETRGSAEGLDLFDKWSALGAGYGGFDVCRDKWASFEAVGPGGQTVTMRSYIRDRYLEERSEERTIAFDLFVARIAAVENHHDLLGVVAEEIAGNTVLTRIDRNMLAERIRARYRALTQSNIRVSDINRLIALRDDTGEIRMGQNRWAGEWVYALDKERMVSVRTKDTLTDAAFCAKYNRLLPEDEQRNAALFARDVLQVPIVDKIQYHPAEEALFTVYEEGIPRECVNSFKASSVPAPKPEDEWTPRDKRNVRLVQEHLFGLFAEEWEARAVVDWLAWIVQNPGRYARWSVILVGVQGDGKTWIAKMMQRVLGSPNVNFTNLQELDGEFTDWATDCQMVVFDEIKISGRNRHQIIEKMKRFIANDSLAINEKFIKRRQVQNMASYFMTSNHLDAIPLSEDDRRFWPIKTKWQSRQEMLESGTRDDKYFEALFRAIEESPGAIRQWFLGWELDPAFSANNPPARKTALAQAMIEHSVDELEMALRTMIEEETTPFITEDYVSSTIFSSILKDKESPIALDARPSNRRLGKFFAMHPDLIKVENIRTFIDGKWHTLWTTRAFAARHGNKSAAIKAAIREQIQEAIASAEEERVIDEELNSEL